MRDLVDSFISNLRVSTSKGQGLQNSEALVFTDYMFDKNKSGVPAQL